jgi:hypothetical protein
MTTVPFVRATTRMFGGVIIWAAHFTVIYGFTALACARGFASAAWLGSSVVQWTVGAATLLAALGTLALIVPAVRAARAGFEAWLSASVSGLALIAIVWEGMAALMVPACA